MDVAVIGAGGEVGREVCAQLIEASVVTHEDTLQLVTHRGGPSELGVHGLLVDLKDAFSELAPELSVAFTPEEVKADVIIFLAGPSIPHDPNAAMTRQDLGTKTLPIFQYWAQGLAEHGTGRELVLVQSNPVELGVKVFSDALGRHRVLGAAAYNDSLRFRREIANEAGVSRRDVAGFVLGQHGPQILPVWSQVHIRGWSEEQTQEFTAKQTAGEDLEKLPDRIGEAAARLLELIKSKNADACVEFLDALPIDIRIAVKPFFVHYSGRTTAVVTAHSIVELTRAVAQAESVIVPAQVCLDGDWPGFTAPVAVPVVLMPDRWRFTRPGQLTDYEQARLEQIHDHIRNEIEAVLG